MGSQIYSSSVYIDTETLSVEVTKNLRRRRNDEISSKNNVFINQCFLRNLWITALKKNIIGKENRLYDSKFTWVSFIMCPSLKYLYVRNSKSRLKLCFHYKFQQNFTRRRLIISVSVIRGQNIRWSSSRARSFPCTRNIPTSRWLSICDSDVFTLSSAALHGAARLCAVIDKLAYPLTTPIDTSITIFSNLFIAFNFYKSLYRLKFAYFSRCLRGVPTDEI